MKDLRSLRTSNGYTIEQLAKKAELHPLTIQNIENQLTIPQNDCRRRIELVFGIRINWLTTTGLKPQPKVIWEFLEQDLRNLMYKVNSLPESQQSHFLEILNEYKLSLIGLLKEQKHANHIPINETKALTLNRKKKLNKILEENL